MTAKCKFSLSMSRAEPSQAVPDMSSMAAIVESVRALYLDTKYTDLEIRCDGRSFKVHRAIVCPRSKVLDKECSGGFLESDTRVIEHKVFDADTMDRMLQFIYRGEYSVNSGTQDLLKGTRAYPFTPVVEGDSTTSPPLTNTYQSITCMAAYQTKSFEELRLEEHGHDLSPLHDAVEQHVQIYFIADYYELLDLKNLALKGFQAMKSSILTGGNQSLVSMIKTIYGNTPTTDKQLRPEILKFCFDEKKRLLIDNSFTKALIEEPELQDFTADFLVCLHEYYENHIEQEEASHSKVVQYLRLETESLSRDVLAKQAQNATLSGTLSRVQAQIAELLAIQTCRNCSRTWNYFLERHGPNGYLAKCYTCKAKHYSSHGAV